MIQAKLFRLRPARRVPEISALQEDPPGMSHSAATTTRDPRLNAQIDALLAGHHSDPFALLGPHPVEGNWVVRFFLPWAAEASISLSPPAAQGTTPAPAIVTGAVKLRPEGFFEVIWPSSRSEEHTSELQSREK